MKVLITPNMVLYISLSHKKKHRSSRFPHRTEGIQLGCNSFHQRHLVDWNETTTGATTHHGLDPPPRRAANIQLDWNLWLSDSKGKSLEDSDDQVYELETWPFIQCLKFTWVMENISTLAKKQQCRTLQHEICGYGLGCIKRPPQHCLHAWNCMFFHTPQSSKTTSSDSSAPVTVMLAPPGLSSIWGYPVRPVNHFHILGWSGFPSVKIKGWFIKPQVACTPPTKSLSKFWKRLIAVVLQDCLSPRVPPLRKVFIAW